MQHTLTHILTTFIIPALIGVAGGIAVYKLFLVKKVKYFREREEQLKESKQTLRQLQKTLRKLIEHLRIQKRFDELSKDTDEEAR